MVARIEPGGERQSTAAPRVAARRGKLFIEAVEPGISLGYSVDGGPWQLYTGPVELPAGVQVKAKAVRYGWEESPEVSVTF